MEESLSPEEFKERVDVILQHVIVGNIGGRWTVGLDDLRGLFQPQCLYHSMILSTDFNRHLDDELPCQLSTVILKTPTFGQTAPNFHRRDGTGFRESLNSCEYL